MSIEPLTFAAMTPSRPEIRHDWTQAEIQALLAAPFNDLLHQSHCLHRRFFDPNQVQLSTLLNIKEGGCPEDCAYCPQSMRYQTGVEATPAMTLEDVKEAARLARSQGAGRFCMGAAWRSPKKKDIELVADMIRMVKQEGLETCATLGMLTGDQAEALKRAGLDYYNHNLDTSPGHYEKIISTRTYQDRLDTLENVRNAGIKVCCGGIIGMGEDVNDRAGLLHVLATLPRHPESVPINLLVRVEGTPLANEIDVDELDFVRMIAAARIVMPASYVRLSAGRSAMSDAVQALCFYAGANSIFYGDRLLTTGNPEHERDMRLFSRLGIRPAGSDPY